MAQNVTNAGSIWRRWDPHIHGPGTVLNDQFGEKAWDDYIDRLETAAPAIEALGVTDYYVLDFYERLLQVRQKGRLAGIGLVFPNIEMRLGIGTDKGAPVNFHLLISPDDPKHVTWAKRFLRRLTYKLADGETYNCSKEDLVLLGKSHAGEHLDERAALKAGANQFKVSIDEFLQQWADDPWIQENALIGVPASSRDGTSGLQKDKSLSSLRQKIETAAHVIFSSQERQRKFWLGEGGKLDADAIRSDYGGLKPCLHGSDAHDLEKVGEPTLNRYCWLKGDPCFETLRQACLEPKHRVAIGETPPEGAYSSQTITRLEMTQADWFGGGEIALNGSLVGIIGARGSGKSALADMIAAGGYNLSAHVSPSSFVSRAEEYLTNAEAELTWGDGQTTSNTIAHVEMEGIFDTPRVRYLSQKFVEQLCSAEGATDELVSEINRVIYHALPEDERLDTDDFDELLSVTARQGREARALHEEELAGLGSRVAEQRNKKDGLAQLKKEKREAEEQVKTLDAERQKLVPKDAEAHAKAFEKVTAAVSKIGTRIEKARRRMSEIEVIETYVASYEARLADEELEQLKLKYADAGLEDDDWKAFRRVFAGDPAAVIAKSRSANEALVKRLEGSSLSENTDPATPPSEDSLIPSGADLTGLPLSVLKQERDRLSKLIGSDEANGRRHRSLSDTITRTNKKIAALTTQIETAEKADDQINALLALRTKSYAGIFDGIVAEEAALKALYEPLQRRLSTASGALGSLTFSVKRHVDLEAWASRGEALIDARKAGDFKGKGSLFAAAEEKLTEAWRVGTSKDVAEAMTAFREQYDDTLKAASKVDRKDVMAWREWGSEVSEWLYGTDHIGVRYTLQYDGVDIERLSPGTRGIVLLLLYLAIDIDDHRPLIIDQPEENLDPQSIYDELVGLFREAKHRRQIIIVTHNANLIVNTDADQVIVAFCGPAKKGHLPDITYTPGSLEDPVIRKQVCDILEGGERAFQDRARRLRVRVDK